MEQIDLKRYQLVDPQGTGAPEWKAAVDNGLAQVQHQAVRVENLDLLGEHGPMAWRMYNSYVEGVHAGVKRELDATKVEIEAVNKKRKLAQTQGGGKVRELEMQWDELSRKNIQIDAAVQRLDAEIEKLEPKGDE